MRKKTSGIKAVPYGTNDDIYVVQEMQYKKDAIVPGTYLKIKGEHERFRFIQLVHNSKLDVSWIDVMGTAGWRSFYLDKITGVVKQKGVKT